MLAVNLEIEFKNLLHKEEYEQLLHYFSIDKTQVNVQTNIYFDTWEKSLKNMEAALRIRKKQDAFELTLKTKDPRGALELNQAITQNHYFDLINKGLLIKGEVYEALVKLAIDPNDLHVIAKLTTKRVEVPYKNGIIFLDESSYGHVVDYELEYEALDYTEGLETFKQFLELHQIPIRHAQPKIRRAETQAQT